MVRSDKFQWENSKERFTSKVFFQLVSPRWNVITLLHPHRDSAHEIVKPLTANSTAVSHSVEFHHNCKKTCKNRGFLKLKTKPPCLLSSEVVNTDPLKIRLYLWLWRNAWQMLSYSNSRVFRGLTEMRLAKFLSSWWSVQLLGNRVKLWES